MTGFAPLAGRPLAGDADTSGGGGGPPPTGVIVEWLTPTTQGDNWPATVITGFIDIGAQDDTLQIVAVVSLLDNDVFADTALLDGISGTRDVLELNHGGQRAISVFRWQMPTQSGSKAFVITCDDAAVTHILHWFRVTGAADTLVDLDSSDGTTPVTLDVVADGAVLGAATFLQPAEDLDDMDFNRKDDEGSLHQTSGHVHIAADGTFDVACSLLSGGDTGSIVGLSFAPAVDAAPYVMLFVT